MPAVYDPVFKCYNVQAVTPHPQLSLRGRQSYLGFALHALPLQVSIMAIPVPIRTGLEKRGLLAIGTQETAFHVAAPGFIAASLHSCAQSTGTTQVMFM